MEIKEMSDAELAAVERTAYDAFVKAKEIADKLVVEWNVFYKEQQRRAVRAEIRKEMEKEHGTTQQPNTCCSAHGA